MDELTLYEDKLTYFLSIVLYSTILASLKTKIMEIKIGHSNRYHIVTETVMVSYSF